MKLRSTRDIFQAEVFWRGGRRIPEFRAQMQLLWEDFGNWRNRKRPTSRSPIIVCNLHLERMLPESIGRDTSNSTSASWVYAIELAVILICYKWTISFR